MATSSGGRFRGDHNILWFWGEGGAGEPDRFPGVGAYVGKKERVEDRPWQSPRNGPLSAFGGTSPPKGSTPTTSSHGNGAIRASPTTATAVWPSSSSRSRCRSPGA